MNSPLFRAETERLRAKGYSVVNPLEINSDPTAGWSTCMRLDIAELVTCEGIALLPGWQMSKGATLERHIAQALGMKIMQASEA